MQTLFVKQRTTLFIFFALLVLGLGLYWGAPKINDGVDLIQRLSLWAAEVLEQMPVVGFVAFFLLYVIVCAVPFPFVSFVTVLMGYLFGLTYGLLMTSFGSAIGGSVLFLTSRYWLSQARVEPVLERFPAMIPALKTDDFWVATGIRFIPGLPFFIPSIVLSLTQIPSWKFYLSTQLGLLLTLAVYVNAGASLAEFRSVDGLFPPRLIVSMLLLAGLPVVFRLIQKRQ